MIVLTALNRINNEMQNSVSDTDLTTILKDFRITAKNGWVSSLKPFNYFKNMPEIKACNSSYSKWVYKLLEKEAGSYDAEATESKLEVIGRRVARSILKPQNDNMLIAFLNERTVYVTALSLLMVNQNEWETIFKDLSAQAKTLRNYMLCVLYFIVDTPNEDVIRDTLESARHTDDFLAYIASLIL
jgi:hypothetical protein